MRVLSCNQFGPLGGLTFEERPSPAVTPGTIRIAVRAVGVNFVDGLMAEGRYQVRPPLPYVPGGELVGTVVEVGEGVASPVVGDRVCVLMFVGGFAEEVVVPAFLAVPAPTNLSDGQAATYLQSYCTAWFALCHRAGVGASDGRSILVLGAGGGVGLAAVDVARAFGLRVLAAASSGAKRELALAYGAEAVVDTAHEDVKAAARGFAGTREAGGRGVDLVYDPVGGSLAEPSLRALANDGQYLVVGFAAGEIPRIPLNLVLLGNRRIVGVDWGGWSVAHPFENLAVIAEIGAAIERGDLRPVAPREYPFAEAVSALTDQVERRVTGKSVVLVAD